jgi:hypothetical protein
MIFKLSDYLTNEAAIIEQKRRATTFKITPIDNIVAWRLANAKKLAEFDAKREAKKATAAEIIAGPDAPVGERTWDGIVKLSDIPEWSEKIKEARFRRRKLVEVETAHVQKLYAVQDAQEEPKIKQSRVVAWLKQLWEDATASRS